MKVNFVTWGNDAVASYRYHVRIPAEQLAERGAEVRISAYPLLGFDIYIFHKHFNALDNIYIAECKSKGKKTVYHICDNHFDTAFAPHYHVMCKYADLLLCSTNAMQKIIRKETGREAVVIPDPFEYEVKTPSYAPEGKLKCLWYGFKGNIQPLFNFLMKNYQDLSDTVWRVVSDYTDIKMQWPDLEIEQLPWTHDQMLESLDWCDVVVLPQVVNPRTIIKSHNRVTTAVVRGKFVIADELPDYRVYKNILWIGDVKKGLAWFKKQSKAEILKRITNAQKIATSKFSPSVVGEKWHTALKKLEV